MYMYYVISKYELSSQGKDVRLSNTLYVLFLMSTVVNYNYLTDSNKARTF